MEQNSDKWLEWRRQGIGASDAPIIMGVSPWQTPYQLWQTKMGVGKNFQGNFATQRGHDLEPKARASFELEVDGDFPATLASHSTMPWLRASLDGFNKDTNEILEIKCPGEADHRTANEGRIPDKYRAQVQHQLLVTGAARCYYYSFDGENGVTVIVEPDVSYINDELLPKLEEFYKYMKTETPPPLTDKDQVKVDDPELVKLAEQYAKLDDDAKAIKAAMDAIKKELVDKIDAVKAKVGRLAITKSVTKGSVQYDKIPALDGVDVEEFRKASYEKVSMLK